MKYLLFLLLAFNFCYAVTSDNEACEVIGQIVDVGTDTVVNDSLWKLAEIPSDRNTIGSTYDENISNIYWTYDLLNFESGGTDYVRQYWRFVTCTEPESEECPDSCFYDENYYSGGSGGDDCPNCGGTAPNGSSPNVLTLSSLEPNTFITCMQDEDTGSYTGSITVCNEVCNDLGMSTHLTSDFKIACGQMMCGDGGIASKILQHYINAQTGEQSSYYVYTCDRNCEDVGLSTILVDGDNDIFTDPQKECIDLDCSAYETSCTAQCGGVENILNYSCDNQNAYTFSERSCECKEPEAPIIPDFELPEPTITYANETDLETAVNNETPDPDNTLQNSLLQQINNNIISSGTNNQSLLNTINSNVSLLGQVVGANSEFLANTLGQKMDKTNELLEEQKKAYEEDLEKAENKEEELEEKMQLKKSESDTNDETNSGYLDSLTDSYVGIYDNFENIKSMYEGGFGTVSSTSASAPSCLTFNLYGRTITINVCSFVSDYAPIFTLFVELMLLIVTAKIVVLGLRSF